MTLEEAKKVAAICSEADGGCSHCAQVLMDKLIEEFPDFHWWWDDEWNTDIHGINVEEKK